MEKIEKYQYAGSKECKKVLAENPTYKLFWQNGFSFRGAREGEIKREGLRKTWIGGDWREATFEEEMQSKYNWAANISITVDHEKKEIHMNGFSENDMY
jgi:hypothetical protein